MTKRNPRATWLCLLALGACSSGDDDGGSAGGSGGPSGGNAGSPAAGAGGGGGAAGRAGSSASGTAGSGASSGGSGASGSGDSGSGASGSGAGGDGGAGGSQPSDAGAGGASGGSCGTDTGGSGGTPTLQCGALPGSCGQCIAEKCCELTELCSANADCACMAMCIGTQSLAGVAGCLDTCGVDGSPPGFANLATCVAPTCPDGDECSAPAGFAPPPDIAASGQSSSTEIGSGMLADCSFDASLAYDPNGDILQLESADGSLCARIERRDDGPGSMANTRFTLISMLVGPLGEVVQLDDSADVCWYSSHHNFNDWAHGWSGSRHYDLKMARADHGVAPTYSLQVFEQGPLEAAACPAFAEGSCQVGDAIELFPVSP